MATDEQGLVYYHYIINQNPDRFFFSLSGKFCARFARHSALSGLLKMCQHKSSVKWVVLNSSGVHLMIKSTYNGYCFCRIINEIKSLGQVIVHKNVSHVPRSFFLLFILRLMQRVLLSK